MMCNIDLKAIWDAVMFYSNDGYDQVSVPMLVRPQISLQTKPRDRRDIYHECDGDGTQVYVASAEQSFIQMFVNSELKPGKYQAITPCVRDEPKEDYIHFRVFLKLELINVGERDVDAMINDALRVYKLLGVDTEAVQTDIGYDLVDESSRIELGSYGTRNMPDGTPYVYGTGLAEPRYSICKEIRSGL